MIQIAILKRRLRPRKTYDDFRRAWYHTVGFGTSNKMFSAINVADPREIIVVGLNETTIEDIRRLIGIDREQREANPLDDIIEPGIERTFGILVAEDDFSSANSLDYKPASICGRETDMAEVAENLRAGAKLLIELYSGQA